MNGGCSLVQEGVTRSQMSKYGHGASQTPELCCHYCKLFCEDRGGLSQCRRKGPELVVVSALTEAKKFVVSQVDVDMKVRIFHAESCEPDSSEKGGNNQCEMNVQNFVLQMKVLRIWTLSIGRSPPPFFGMRNTESRNPSQ